MRDSDGTPTPGVRVEPGGPGTARRDPRDQVFGLLGVVFFGSWMIFFGVATIFMVAIIATGADDLPRTILVAVLCAAVSVFNGLRLRRPLRRLRGTSVHTPPDGPARNRRPEARAEARQPPAADRSDRRDEPPVA